MKATIVSVQFDVQETSASGQTYAKYILQYVTENKENKTYKGMMSALRFNKVLNTGLRAVKQGDDVNLTFVPQKNNPKYQELQSVDVIGGAQQAAQNVAPTASSGGGYNKRDFETKEERDAKQILIIRQSCASTAANFLSAPSRKKEATVFELLDVAKQLEAYVLNKDAANKDNAVMVDDIPFDVDDIPQ